MLPTPLLVLLFFVIPTALAVAMYASQTVCPGCQARGSLRWRHVTRKGRPDARYRDNPWECGRCGWRQVPPEGEAALSRARELVDRALAEAGDLPVQHLIRLLKFVAVADRRFPDTERRAIAAAVTKAFPGRLSEERVLYWLEIWDPDPAELDAYVAPFREPPELRDALLDAIEAVAVADGKATKSERERIAAIRSALGGVESPPDK